MEPFIVVIASFLGDGGGTVLGVVLGAIRVRLISKAPGPPSVLASILVMMVPLFDTSLAMGRRLISRRPLFAGDRSHFDDCLMQRGLTQQATVTVGYDVGALGSWGGGMVSR